MHIQYIIYDTIISERQHQLEMRGDSQSTTMSNDCYEYR